MQPPHESAVLRDSDIHLHIGWRQPVRNRIVLLYLRRAPAPRLRPMPTQMQQGLLSVNPQQENQRPAEEMPDVVEEALLHLRRHWPKPVRWSTTEIQQNY